LLELDLGGFSITNKIFKALARSILAKRLRTLVINGYKLSSSGFTRKILDKFKVLEKLSVSYNYQLKNKGFKQLSESDLAGRLVSLSFTGNELTQGCFTKDILDKFTSLTEFEACWGELGDSDFQELAQSNLASQLVKLELYKTCISEEFIQKFRMNFISLKELLHEYASAKNTRTGI
jgi:hypothetical protein